MAITARDFGYLRGRLIGFSDRALDAHLSLYQAAVARLAELEAAYPIVEWSGDEKPEPQDASDILATPVASLDLRPIGMLAECLSVVDGELAARGITFRPHFYLGDNEMWATDRGTSINLPWYLANPMLMRLAQRGNVAAYTAASLVRDLRHEVGHVIGYAFELWRLPSWSAAFGEFTAPYRDEYAPDPASTDHVNYTVGSTRGHYAQKHPDEDWAETFAAWLDPSFDWATNYRGWPRALAKLQYVDALWHAGMLKGAPPNRVTGRTVPYRRLRGTVGQLLGITAAVRPLDSTIGDHAELLRAEPGLWNKIVLHELFFEALNPATPRDPPPMLRAAAESAWGAWESYLLDLRTIAGATDGWAVTCWDPRASRLRNALVEASGEGLLAGCPVVLALDCHEHAYAMDFGATASGRTWGIAAFLENVDWTAVAARMPVMLPLEIVASAAADDDLTAEEEDVLRGALAAIDDPDAMDEEIDAAFDAVRALDNDEALARLEAHAETMLDDDGRKMAGRSSGDRVPVVREVRRNGRTHKQVYWVKQNSVRPTDRAVKVAARPATPARQAKVRQALAGERPAAKPETHPTLGGLNRRQIAGSLQRIRAGLAAGKQPSDRVLRRLGAKSIDDLNAKLKKAGMPPVAGGRKARGTPPNTVAAKETSLASQPVKKVMKTFGEDSGNLNVSHYVELADGTRGYFKPAQGEESVYSTVPKGTYYKREAATYQLDRALGLGIVPPTVVRNGPGGVGSIQAEHSDASVPKNRKTRGGHDVADLDGFQKMRLLDIVAGNQDRHEGNWLPRYTADGKLTPAPIDHGLTFPRLTPNRIYQKLPEHDNPSIRGETTASVKGILAKADLAKVAGALKKSDLEPEAVRGALARLQALKDDPQMASLSGSGDAGWAWHEQWLKKSREYVEHPDVVKAMADHFPEWEPKGEREISAAIVNRMLSSKI